MKKHLVYIFLACLLVQSLYAGGKPEWVSKPSAVYPDSRYVSAVGGGQNRAAAENSAVAALAGYFRQSVSSRTSITERESQVNSRSASRFEFYQSIETAAALDSLIGVEIRGVWNDKRGGSGWWAIAVMEKARGRERYTAELDAEIAEINRLSDIAGGVSFETISRCRTAQRRFSDAEVYALVLSMLDSPDRLPELGQLAARVDNALNEAMSIPVDIRVTGERDSGILSAFTNAFTDQGFRIGSANSRYAFEINVRIERATRGQSFSTTYIVDAVLRDTLNGTQLFRYNFSHPEPHPTSQTEANTRAQRRTVEKIENEFPGVLRERLD